MRTDGWTDSRQTESHDEANSLFSQSGNAPKNWLSRTRNREHYCAIAVSSMRHRWSEARGTGFTPRPSLSWCRILNWPGGPTGKVSTILSGMKIKFERSRCDRVTTSILFSQVTQRRYSTDRTSAHMSCSMYTQHAGHVVGILTAAHSHTDATIGDETFRRIRKTSRRED